MSSVSLFTLELRLHKIRWTCGRVYNLLEKSAAYEKKHSRFFLDIVTRKRQDVLTIIELQSEISMHVREIRWLSSYWINVRWRTASIFANARVRGKEGERATRRTAPAAIGRGVFTLHLWIYSCIHGRALRDDTHLSRVSHPPDVERCPLQRFTARRCREGGTGRC